MDSVSQTSPREGDPAVRTDNVEYDLVLDLIMCVCCVLQDGSCNGLQHYAALGRDLEGGASVNLVPSDQPQDVYKGVAVGVSVS